MTERFKTVARRRAGLKIRKSTIQPPPPTSDLPFAEAQLRSGFVTLTTANIPVGTAFYTLPTSADYLIDLGWVMRDRALKIYTRPGQRVHARNVYINVQANVASAYQRGGFGYRPLSLNSPPSEHLSLTGCLVTGPWLADGLTYGDSTQTFGPGATRVTFQKCRIESASLVNGGVAAAEPTEHCDAFQMQGPLNNIEFGLCTFYRQWTTNDPGKGLMLNAYSATGLAYTVAMNKVNFRDYPGATRCGAAWFKEESEITMTLTDVYCLNEGNPSASWAWPTTQGFNTTSGLFMNYANKSGPSQGWTNTGTAPNRVATFPAATGITGQVTEGKSSDGEDWVTRADLGLA